MKNDKKNRINIVYSTNPDFHYEYESQTEAETLATEKQNLKVIVDSRQRHAPSSPSSRRAMHRAQSASRTATVQAAAGAAASRAENSNSLQSSPSNSSSPQSSSHSRARNSRLRSRPNSSPQSSSPAADSRHSLSSNPPRSRITMHRVRARSSRCTELIRAAQAM